VASFGATISGREFGVFMLHSTTFLWTALCDCQVLAAAEVGAHQDATHDWGVEVFSFGFGMLRKASNSRVSNASIER